MLVPAPPGDCACGTKLHAPLLATCPGTSARKRNPTRHLLGVVPWRSAGAARDTENDASAVLSFVLCACNAQRKCGGDMLTTSLQSGDKAMPPEHMQNSLGRLCLFVHNGIPSRPERKKRPLCNLPTHPLAVASRPLPCNVGGFGIPRSNKKGTIFRTGKPVPISVLLAANIASTGGAGVRHGEDGGDVFFARDGPGDDGVALLCVWVRARVCVCAWDCCVGH